MDAIGLGTRQGSGRDRRLPAILTAVLLAATTPAGAVVLSVTTLLDIDAADGQCSLREAIVAANTDAPYRECDAGSGADVVALTVAGTVALVADLPAVEEALTVRGLGAEASIVDGGDAFEILSFTSATPGNGEVLRVEGLQLARGRASEGGAVHVGRYRAFELVDALLLANRSTSRGGAVYCDRPLGVDIERTSFLGNAAGTSGGALAVDVDGIVTVIDSTFAGNTAEGGVGGAIHVQSIDELRLVQSTLSGNAASGDGGGLAAVVAPFRLERSTITGNQADTDRDDSGDGGGISLAGAVTGTLMGTIVAGNVDDTATGILCPDGFQKLGASIESDGFNLVGVNDCIEPGFPSGEPNVNGDLVGTSGTPLDPVLGALADNGGPTWTHLPDAAGPVVDQGSCPGVGADQRGYGDLSTLRRPVDDPSLPNVADGCDIGSVEVGGVPIAGFVFVDGFESGDTSRWSATER